MGSLPQYPAVPLTLEASVFFELGGEHWNWKLDCILRDEL